MLDEKQLDILKEFINIGIGKSAALLNEMLGASIKLNVPHIWIDDITRIQHIIPRSGDNNYSAIKLNYRGPFDGTAQLIFPSESAANLVSLLTGEEIGSPDLDSLRSGTLNEVANIILNGVLGSISNIMNDGFRYTVPVYREGDIDYLVNNEFDNSVVLLSETNFSTLEMNVSGSILLAVHVDSLDLLRERLNLLSV